MKTFKQFTAVLLIFAFAASGFGFIQSRGWLLQPAGTYHNWGAVYGTSGYGLYDDGGTLKFKNSGGSWSALAPSTEGDWSATVNSGLNPRRPSQAIDMLAAASGSTGITTADNANLDFGTGNFTLPWKGSLPDWTPAATVVLAQKTDGTNGWNLQVVATTGVLRLTINTTDYDSTAAPVITDGMVGKIGVSVTRETASVAGSVVFYFNGVALGNSVAIGAGAPTTVNNASALYILGTSSTRTAGAAHFFAPLNYALSAAQQLSLFRNGILFDNQYGNFTEKVTGTLVLTDGTGWDTNVSVTFSGAGADFNAANDLIRESGFLTAGKRYRATVVIAANTATLKLDDTGITPYASITDTGTVVVDFLATGGTFELIQSGAGAITVTSLSVHPIGAVAAYEPEGIQPAPGQWLDSSTNKLHAMQPAAGSSAVRPMREFEVRWTNTWAGTHEAQYIGGVNQAVLPANAYLTQIIGVVTGGTIEDIIIGDGSDTDHWVAATTGLATGTTAFTIANPISDGTNYKLVVDPDANFTGSIAFTVKGFILQ